MPQINGPAGTGILITVEDRVATLTLDRPPLNVLSIRTCEVIASSLRGLSALDEVGVLVLAGAGRAFSAGADVGEHRGPTVAAMLRAMHSLGKALLEFPRPTIARVHGAALGGGCELVLCCDVAVAASSATLGLPEIGLGVFPPLAATLLPRLAGRRAAEAILWGETMTAAAALRMGLVTEVVPPGRLDAAVAAHARRATKLSLAALRIARRALRRGAEGSFDEALEAVEEIYLNELMRSEDATEGLDAFQEKRPPRWRHR
jgi:cyclohexa-1,5-dienecarbonyl-CoA hydratase